jgi:hypothetical protein
MATAVVADTPPESQGPKSAWRYFLVLHFDHFANLVRYLVADAGLVERVMTRVVARLERTPFDASDALGTYKQARRTLIKEAMAVLSRCEDLSRRSDRRSSATRPTFKDSHPSEAGSETTLSPRTNSSTPTGPRSPKPPRVARKSMGQRSGQLISHAQGISPSTFS